MRRDNSFFDPLVFPVIIDVSEFLVEAVPSSNSILFYTLPKLYGTTENETDILWTSFENRFWDELEFDETLWNRLARFSIFKQDPLETVLSLTIGVLIHAFDTGEAFEILCSKFTHEVETVLKTHLVCSGEELFDDVPILRNLRVNDLLYIFDIPRDLIARLSVGQYGFWKGMAELSERGVLSELGFNFDSLQIIESLWSVRPWIKGASEVMNGLRSSFSVAKSFEDMIIMAVTATLEGQNNAVRDAKIAIEYLRRSKGWSKDRQLVADEKSLDEPAQEQRSHNTLEELGRRFRLTRERIRQISNGALNRLSTPENLRRFDSFWVVMYNILCANGGIVDIEDLPFFVQASFRWQNPPQIEQVLRLVSLNPALSVDCHTKSIYLKNYTCAKCEKLLSQLIQLVNKTTNEISVQTIQSRLQEYCEKSCDYNAKTFESISPILIKLLLSKHHPQVRVEGDYIYQPQGWTIRYGNLQEASESILQQSDDPLHYSEVYGKMLEAGRDGFISETSIHCALANSENALLWDRGTFVHKDYVRAGQSFADEVSEWLLRQMKDGIKFISIAGAFSHFRAKCKGLGITSETALYSVLRLTNRRSLFLNRYPFVTKKAQKIVVRDLLEQYVLQNDGEVRKQDLKNLLKKYHFKNPLASVLCNIPDLLYSDNDKIIHADNMNLNMSKFHDLCKYACSLLADSNIINVRKVYRDKKISCKLLGINSPRLLFSCFQNFGKEYVITGHYGQLRSLSTRHIKGLGIRNDFEDYVKRHSPCSKDQLVEHFVEQMGCSAGAIATIPYYSDNIMLYTPGCYIHMDALGWRENQYEQLMQILRNSYVERTKTGGLYARLKNVYDYRYSELPKIHGDFPWTLMLLRSLAERTDEFIFLGNAKDAYVKINTTNKIKSLHDLIYDLLYQEYDGAANKEELEKRLVNKGILRKRLTPNMIGDSGKLIINGNNVIAKDLVRNV